MTYKIQSVSARNVPKDTKWVEGDDPFPAYHVLGEIAAFMRPGEFVVLKDNDGKVIVRLECLSSRDLEIR